MPIYDTILFIFTTSGFHVSLGWMWGAGLLIGGLMYSDDEKQYRKGVIAFAVFLIVEEWARFVYLSAVEIQTLVPVVFIIIFAISFIMSMYIGMVWGRKLKLDEFNRLQSLEILAVDVDALSDHLEDTIDTVDTTQSKKRATDRVTTAVIVSLLNKM